MNKKRLIVLIAVITVVIAAAAFLFFSGLTPSTGYVIAADDSYLIVLDSSPVVMDNRTGNEDLFTGLRTGSKVLILHDGIAVTYPGQTGVYFCLNLEAGNPDRIPAEMMEDLTDMGWITP